MLSIAIRPARDTSFALMDERPVLFSEKNQQIYELDRLGAYIWCKLLEQEKTEGILDGLKGFGIDQSDARQFLLAALHQWLDRDLVEIDWESGADFTHKTGLARHAITIRAPTEELLRRVAPLFCSGHPENPKSDILIELTELGERILFRIGKTGIGQCKRESLAPAIKAYVTELVILQAQSCFALHAAALIINRAGLVLCGHPGVGKSTLALHLTEAGFQYAGDDIVLIGEDGRAEGIPFSPSAKSGSWPIISGLRSDLNDTLVHRRLDGLCVRYLPVAQVHRGAFSIDQIVFLKRIEGAPAKLTQLGQIEAMKRVIDGSFANDGRLSRDSFIALKRTLTQAATLELTYSGAIEARSILMSLGHGRS